MEVLYHIRPYFVGISPYIGLKNRPQICQVPPIQDPQMAIEFIFFFLVDIGTRKCCGLAPFPWSSWATLTQCCISSGYPLVMTNTSPWLSHGANRNRWFTELKNGWIFPRLWEIPRYSHYAQWAAQQNGWKTGNDLEFPEMWRNFFAKL